MSLREKIGQTCQAQLSQVLARADGDLAGYLARYPVGSLFAGKEIIGGAEADAGRMREVLADCQRASAVPLSVAGDLENGAGGAIRGLTEFPQLMALGAATSPELAYDYGRWTAAEARQAGFNWVFGPVADLSLNWLNPIVGTRCLGDRPDACIPLLQALIRGYQEHGLSATAKHFPGDGVDFRDQHLCLSINSLDEAAWRDSYGRVFAAAIAAGVQSVMAGHIALPWCDASRGRGGRFAPATVSAPVLNRLLRREMGFTGLIVSDALIMAGFSAWADYRERILAAFNAGIDVMLWPGEGYFDLMTGAVETGRVTRERLDESVRRILAFKHTQGLFAPAAAAERSAGTAVTACAGAGEFSRTLAGQGLTLVRNRRKVLPLPAGRIRTALLLVATARPAAAPARVAPLVRKLEARGIQVRVHVNGNCLDVVRMEESGERFDLFLCLFDQHSHELKNTMRPAGEMGECLWTLQNTETLDPVIVSLGGPHLLNDLPFADTLVNAYSSNAPVLEALDKALFGEADFPGQTPVQTGGEWVSRAACPLPANVLEAGPGARPAPAAAAHMTMERFSTPFGENLSYRLYTPPGAGTDGRLPAVLLLHGAGERGGDNTAQLAHGAGRILEYLQSTGTAAYVIAPQCPAGMQWVNTPWDAPDHVMPEYPSLPMKLVLEFLAAILQERPIDPDRVYVTGLSMGGYGAWDALQRQPERFAAGVMVCGGGDRRLAARLNDIPLRVYHGAADNVVPVGRSRAMAAAVQAAGGRITYTEYPEVGHNAWEKAYADPDLYPWLFAQTRSTRHA